MTAPGIRFGLPVRGCVRCSAANSKASLSSACGPAASQPIVSDLLAILIDERVGTVAGVTAQSADGEPVGLELMLLPLSASRPSLARTIGILAPLKAPQWLGSSPIGALTLGSRRHIGAPVETRLLPRFMAPRRRHLVVYEGGRSAGG